jgi:hypothetical protein
VDTCACNCSCSLQEDTPIILSTSCILSIQPGQSCADIQFSSSTSEFCYCTAELPHEWVLSTSSCPEEPKKPKNMEKLKDIPDRAGKKNKTHSSDFQFTPKSPSNGPAAKLAKVPRDQRMRHRHRVSRCSSALLVPPDPSLIRPGPSAGPPGKWKLSSNGTRNPTYNQLEPTTNPREVQHATVAVRVRVPEASWGLNNGRIICAAEPLTILTSTPTPILRLLKKVLDSAVRSKYDLWKEGCYGLSHEHLHHVPRFIWITHPSNPSSLFSPILYGAQPPFLLYFHGSSASQRFHTQILRSAVGR